MKCFLRCIAAGLPGWLLVAVVVSGASAVAAAGEGTSQPLRLESALVTLIEHVEVPALEPGVIDDVAASEGQIVERGQLLVQIDDHQARLALNKAELELEQARQAAGNDVKVRYARKSREVADAELRRALDSIAKYDKSISDTELDRLRLAAERAALEVEQAEFELELAAVEMRLKTNASEAAGLLVARHRLTAPLDAAVVQVHRRAGEWVEPGQSVVRLVRVDRLRVEAFVDVHALSEPLEGAQAVLVLDLPGKPAAEFAGTVTFVSPEANPVTGQTRLWAEVVNRERLLKPGMHGRLVVGPR